MGKTVARLRASLCEFVTFTPTNAPAAETLRSWGHAAANKVKNLHALAGHATLGCSARLRRQFCLVDIGPSICDKIFRVGPGISAGGAPSAAEASVAANPVIAQSAQDATPAKPLRVSMAGSFSLYQIFILIPQRSQKSRTAPSSSASRLPRRPQRRRDISDVTLPNRT